MNGFTIIYELKNYTKKITWQSTKELSCNTMLGISMVALYWKPKMK